MRHEISVPLVNNNDHEVMVVEWHSNVGSRVEAGALLATVSTTKAAVEVPAPLAGVLRWRACAAGESIAVGSVLAVLTDTADEQDTVPAVVAPREPSRGEDRKVSLKARVLARNSGVSLDTIVARRDGRITQDDVRRAIENRTGREPVSAQPEAPPKDGSILIIGDSAHARFVRDLCVRCGYGNIVGCVSEALPKGETLAGMPVLGRDQDLAGLFASGIAMAAIGVGSSRAGIRSNDTRQRLFDLLKGIGFRLPVLVDPDASVSQSALFGEGTMVGAGAVVSANAVVGKNVLVNVGAIVCHDCVIEDHVHVTPGAILAGSVFVGMGSTIGMGSTVLDGTRVGRGCLILNNVRVIRDVEDHTVVKC